MGHLIWLKKDNSHLFFTFVKYVYEEKEERESSPAPVCVYMKIIKKLELWAYNQP